MATETATPAYRTATAFILIAVAAGLGPLLLFAITQGGRIGLDAYVWRVLSFTLLQASLSTVISVALALPTARALVRHRSRARPILLSILAVPQSLPAIVVVLMLVTLFGASGLMGGLLNLYGLAGILLAHVYFNMPLALRVFTQTLQGIPPENRRLAAQLGLHGWSLWRMVEWPALRPVIPRIAALIFLLCAGSFVVVLTLGGPAATTLEVAIYQSLRMDFDVARALTLSLLQVTLCAVLVALAGRSAWTEQLPRRRMDGDTYEAPGRAERIFNALCILMAALLVGGPLLALLVEGIRHISPGLLMLQALMTSTAIAALSTTLALALAWPIAWRQRRARGLTTVTPLLGLIVPPAVLAMGWFILVRGLDGGALLAAVLIVILNGLMALPFAVNIVAPAVASWSERQERLCAQLGLSGWPRFRIAEFPALRGPLAQAGLYAFSLSLGDLSAVTLLGSQGLVTLPSLLHAQMGHYRSDDAMGTGLLLAILCLGLGALANSKRLAS
ncbi:MAG: ABC transporter permease subunit [Proteobacteria bacterium]|nr:ABC transporter permease subunit [Pseudomonadota bacterium]